MAANKTRTRKDNFISKIVKDPASPPKTILLRGYLGDSSEEGHTRLYLDAQLNNYVEIPDDAILHEEDVAKDQSPLGETYVWIKQDAQVIHGEAGPQRRKSSFFEGSIAAAAAGAPGLGPPIGVSGLGPACPTGIHCFPTPICTIGPECVPQTHNIPCIPPPTAHCTLPPGCPVLSAFCPTQPLHG